jgi:hypothetical protein
MDPAMFGFASLVTRAARFFLVAALLWKLGAPAKVFIERHLNVLAAVFLVLLIGGFVVLRWLF